MKSNQTKQIGTGLNLLMHCYFIGHHVGVVLANMLVNTLADTTRGSDSLLYP